MEMDNLVFYKTQPTECPYLENRLETKVLTNLNIKEAENLYAGLLLAGFRRSQTLAYKPMCQSCSSCQSIRIIVDDFKPNKTQKRNLKQNSYLKRKIVPPHFKIIHYDLYQNYIHNRHAGEDMANMSFDDIKAMVEHTTIDTVLIEYYDLRNNHLCGWVITDLTPHGPSMVYSVFDPAYTRYSLGTYAILNHINLSHELGMPYLFLGYWIKDCQKMTYKTNFMPYELHINTEWVRFDKFNKK